MKDICACFKVPGRAGILCRMSVLGISLWMNSGAVAGEYLPGGALAGMKLPAYATQHGEAPGYPGCIPELAAAVLVTNPAAADFTPQDQAPEVELYPGASEHYRAYWFKYCPVRSPFDRQSQLKNWTAPEIPTGGGKRAEEYAEPVYWVPRYAPPANTGKTLRPVAVIRCGTNQPVFRLELGALDRGLYALRVIGAVETAKLRPFRAPLYLRLKVNDGPAGATNTYRLRIGYCDEFYSVAEFYFHAPEKRAYAADLAVDRGSGVELLMRNITLDDALAGITVKPWKRRQTLHALPATPADWKSKYAPDARLARDAEIWEAFPRINAQGSGRQHVAASAHAYFPQETPFGADGKTPEQIESEFGAWSSGTGAVMLVNKKLNLQYTLADHQAGKPLPAPYPYADDGAGLDYPDPKKPGFGQIWCPIAQEVDKRIMDYGAVEPKAYLAKGNLDDARDAAIKLIRYAYAFPALDYANYLSSIIRDPGANACDLRCRRRGTEAMFLTHYAAYTDACKKYDQLFGYLQGNEELAASVGRFVPWVKNSRDVTALLDAYLVQSTARRIMRYNYHTDPTDLTLLAALMGETALTDDWLEWIFHSAHVYPSRPAGMPDILISTYDREGPNYYASTYYCGAGGSHNAASVRADFDAYMRSGGNPRFDLLRFSTKPLMGCYWQMDINIGGYEYLRKDSVCGAEKRGGRFMEGADSPMEKACRWGWAWSQDPRFAWALAHAFGRKGETDADWAQIRAAALNVKRAPWLDNRSRILDNWAAILETGHAHDDFRFRRALYIVASHFAHHGDALDLQLVAHGLPMTVDGGQRGGYSTPDDSRSFSHNTVEVDGKDHAGQAWTQTLADIEGARYLAVNGAPPPGARLFRRQAALIDVDEGAGSQALAATQQLAGVKLPPGITTGNSYVFDVFRVSGGRAHAYCFHAMVNDDFAWNAEQVAAVPTPPADKDAGESRNPETAKPADRALADETGYLAPFKLSPESKFAGNAPDILSATWRYARGIGGGENNMLGANYDPQAPRKFTRLHLLGAQGWRALKADVVCHKVGYRFTDLMVRRQQADGNLESAFAALMEPYAGTPFITACRLLPVKANETDARRAVAVEIKTTNGRTDLCFADGRPEKVREADGSQQAAFSIAGEFAYYSTDAGGLRQAALVGGTRLAGPELKLEAARREYTGRVTAADYDKRLIAIDQRWPVTAGGRVFEIGAPARATGYMSSKVEPQDGGTRITVTRGADFYRSRVEKIAADTGRVTCVLPFPTGKMEFLDKNWTATNEKRTRTWRAEYLGGADFQLTGAPVSAADFEPEGVLRLWEYGAGDSLRQSTEVAVRRLEPGVYEVSGNVNVVLGIKAGALLAAPDRKTWTPLEGKIANGWLSVPLDLEKSAPGVIYLRVSPAP